MKLHETQDFLTAIDRAAAHFSYPSEFILKDYWLSKVLQQLSSSSVREMVVFKGGTCLSKIYRIMDRFSEDIDLALVREATGEPLAGSEHLHINKRPQRAMGRVIKEAVPEELRRNRRESFENGNIYKRVYEIPGQSSAGSKAVGIHNNVVVEVNAMSNPVPRRPHSIQSYVGEYLTDTVKGFDPVAMNMEPFDLLVATVEKTFCEKILALRKAELVAAAGQKPEFFRDRVRHLYDIEKIYGYLGGETYLKDSAFLADLRGAAADDKIFDLEEISNIPPLGECQVFQNSASYITPHTAAYERLKLLTASGKIPALDQVLKTLGIIHSYLPDDV